MNTQLFAALGLVLVTMYVIKYACDSFEDASKFLGRHVYQMKPGVRGATIEAIASSLPELFSTAFLLFIHADMDGFAAGVATCAGSAVFNAAVIPAVCIIAVTTKGVHGERVREIALHRGTLLRDAFFFLAAEGLLIYFLGSTSLAWWMGAAMMVMYIVYFAVLMKDVGGEEEDDDDDEAEEEESDSTSLLGNVLTFNFNELLFQGRAFTKTSAWVVLACATATIALACYLLAEAVIMSAVALDVPAYFTAVILGAAATSVPDTLISISDAMDGDYDDAVSNAVGSNIFDICVALGLPLFAYGLVHGDVVLSSSSLGGASVQELRIALMIVTVIILTIFLTGRSQRNDEQEAVVGVGKYRGLLLGALYLVWTAFIVGRAMELPWLATILGT